MTQVNVLPCAHGTALRAATAPAHLHSCLLILYIQILTHQRAIAACRLLFRAAFAAQQAPSLIHRCISQAPLDGGRPFFSDSCRNAATGRAHRMRVQRGLRSAIAMVYQSASHSRPKARPRNLRLHRRRIPPGSGDASRPQPQARLSTLQNTVLRAFCLGR